MTIIVGQLQIRRAIDLLDGVIHLIDGQRKVASGNHAGNRDIIHGFAGVACDALVEVEGLGIVEGAGRFNRHLVGCTALDRLDGYDIANGYALGRFDVNIGGPIGCYETGSRDGGDGRFIQDVGLAIGQSCDLVDGQMLGFAVCIALLIHYDDQSAGKRVSGDDECILTGLEHSAGVNVLVCGDGYQRCAVSGSRIN